MQLFKQSSGKVLRELMKEEPVMMVGAFNGLVGRMLKSKGFKACYVSGAAITGSTGTPDLG